MFRTLFCWCMLAIIAMTGLVRSDDLSYASASVIARNIKIPGTDYVVGTSFEKLNSTSGQDLIAAIEGWLLNQLSLPPNDHKPNIELVPAQTIVAMRYPLFSKQQWSDQSALSLHDTVAIYDDSTQTIYLADDWNGSTPAELSILVHEMVHHFQNIHGLKYECAQAREELAYRAQGHWLGLFGHDLASDFDLDPFSLLVKTRCF